MNISTKISAQCSLFLLRKTNQIFGITKSGTENVVIHAPQYQSIVLCILSSMYHSSHLKKGIIELEMIQKRFDKDNQRNRMVLYEVYPRALNSEKQMTEGRYDRGLQSHQWQRKDEDGGTVTVFFQYEY